MSHSFSRWAEVNFEEAPLEIIDGDRGKNYPNQADFTDSNYCLFLNTGNVTISGFNFSSCNFINKKKDQALSKGRLQRKDVILTTRGTVGNTAWFDENVPYPVIRINSGMVIFRPELDKLLPEFLYFFIHSPRFRKQISAVTSGTAQPQLPIRDIKGIKIPLPPLEEQQRIAAILDKADAVRRKRSHAIQLTEELLRATFLDMFGDPVTNPKGWEVVSMRDVVSETQYGTGEKANSDRIGIPVLRMNNITYAGEINLNDVKWCQISIEEEAKYTLKKGDLLFNRTNSPELVGKTAVWRSDEKYAYAGYLVRIRFKEGIALPEYISAYLNSSYGKKYLSASGYFL
jgi:type I restriction enzyme, S subunit